MRATLALRSTEHGWQRARRRLAGACVSLATGFASLPAARAESLDPALPIRVPSAPPRSPAVGERLTALGSNQSSVALPKHPLVRWQARVSAPILGAPLVDERGALIVAHGRGRLTAFDSRGRSLFALRTSSELAGAPLLMGGGFYVLVTREAELLFVDREGRLVRRERLPFATLEGALVSAVTPQGGALFASGARMVSVSPRGSELWSASTSDVLRGVFAWRGSSLAVGQGGAVFARGAAGDVRELTTFGAPVSTVALQGDRLLAVVAGHSLVELDLVTRSRTVRWSEPSLSLRDFALAGSGVRLLSNRGVVVALDDQGHELARLALVPDGGAFDASSIVADASGSALVTLGGTPVVLVTPGHEAANLMGTSCPDPLRPTPLSAGLVVTACRSGLLRALSDKAR